MLTPGPYQGGRLGGDRGREVWQGLGVTESGNGQLSTIWGTREAAGLCTSKALTPWCIHCCPTGLHLIKLKVKEKMKNFKEAATAQH